MLSVEPSEQVSADEADGPLMKRPAAIATQDIRPYGAFFWAGIKRLNREVAAALGGPAVQERLPSSGLEPAPTTSARLGEMVRTDLVKWGPVIQRAGIGR